MTLVVARIEGTRIAIAADTLLTEHGKPLPVQGGTIKSCLLPGDICVSFSNSPELAETEFHKFAQTYPLGAEFSDAVSFFERSSEATGNDYIVAFGKVPRLVKIADGRRLKTISNTVWVGDEAAYLRFKEYQARKRQRPERGRAINAVVFADELRDSPASDLYSAMRNLIVDRVPNVGGFVSVISSRDNGFRFSAYSDMLFDWPLSQDETYELNLGDKLDLGASGENAGYSIAQISPGYMSLNLVAFYMVKGRKLFFHYGRNNGLPTQCQVFPDISTGDICAALNQAVGDDARWLAMVTSAPAGKTSLAGLNRAGGVKVPFFVDLNTFPKNVASDAGKTK